MVNEAENDNAELLEAVRLGALDAIDKKEVGRRIHSRMLARGWRQADLARASGLSRNSISNYIKGNQAPSGASLFALASALRVKPADLIPNVKNLSGYDVKSPESRDVVDGYEIRVVASEESYSRLVVNQVVPRKLAFEIAALLEDYHERTLADRSAGG
jgi:transcriptional regulator with XRE-family HTH domain